MGSKTPVTILQEMMTRLGSTPTYSLIFDGSGTHTTIFKIKVCANDVTAIGSGRSKKEAKHEAARIALERLASHQIADQPSGVSPEPVEVVTPYKDQLKENAVGALHDICALNELPMPVYGQVNEDGPPHDKTFAFVCFVGKQKEFGVGRTKKQAKQLAAYNMMNTLKESLGKVLQEVSDEQVQKSTGANLDDAVSKYIASVGTPLKRKRLNRSPYTYHNFFSELLPESQESALGVLTEVLLPSNCEAKDFTTNWMPFLDRVIECLDVQKTVVPARPLLNGNETLFLQISLSSEAVFYGSGSNEEEALQQAAFFALLFFKSLLPQIKNNNSSSSIESVN